MVPNSRGLCPGENGVSVCMVGILRAQALGMCAARTPWSISGPLLRAEGSQVSRLEDCSCQVWLVAAASNFSTGRLRQEHQVWGPAKRLYSKCAPPSTHTHRHENKKKKIFSCNQDGVYSWPPFLPRCSVVRNLCRPFCFINNGISRTAFIVRTTMKPPLNVEKARTMMLSRGNRLKSEVGLGSITSPIKAKDWLVRFPRDSAQVLFLY